MLELSTWLMAIRHTPQCSECAEYVLHTAHSTYRAYSYMYTHRHPCVCLRVYVLLHNFTKFRSKLKVRRCCCCCSILLSVHDTMFFVSFSSFSLFFFFKTYFHLFLHFFCPIVCRMEKNRSSIFVHVYVCELWVCMLWLSIEIANTLHNLRRNKLNSNRLFFFIETWFSQFCVSRIYTYKK